MDKAQKAWKNWGGWAQLVILPIALIVISSCVTKGIEEAKLQEQYIEIACEILAQKTNAENPPSPLRGWAVRLLQEYAPSKVKLQDAELSSLRSGKSHLGSGNYLVDEKGNIIVDDQGRPLLTE